MTANEAQIRPIRAGVYDDLEQAEEAVRNLIADGFTTDEITVVCSDETKERHFREFEHEQPAGANTATAASIGGAIGATVGGAAVAAAGLATGNMPLAIAGSGAGLWTGGILGGFIGAMMTRGAEKSAADYYDQALIDGELLVAVEVHGEDAKARLARAERILSEAGAKPLPLVED